MNLWIFNLAKMRHRDEIESCSCYLTPVRVIESDIGYWNFQSTVSVSRRVASHRGCRSWWAPAEARQRRGWSERARERGMEGGGREKTSAAAFEWHEEATRRNFRNCARHFRMQCMYSQPSGSFLLLILHDLSLFIFILIHFL